MDQAARVIGIDRLELRRRNVVGRPCPTRRPAAMSSTAAISRRSSIVLSPCPTGKAFRRAGRKRRHEGAGAASGFLFTSIPPGSHRARSAAFSSMRRAASWCAPGCNLPGRGMRRPWRSSSPASSSWRARRSRSSRGIRSCWASGGPTGGLLPAGGRRSPSRAVEKMLAVARGARQALEAAAAVRLPPGAHDPRHGPVDRPGRARPAPGAGASPGCAGEAAWRAPC